jgi:uncharacterized protein YukE
MSTPSGSLQQSSTATYSQAVSYLENARTQMSQIQSSVSEQVSALTAAYGGVDGQAYTQVMKTWLEEVDRIKATCEAMENQLNNSLVASNKAQGDNEQAVQQQQQLQASITHGSVSDGVYSSMTS